MDAILNQKVSKIIIIHDVFDGIKHLNAALLNRSPEPIGFLQISLHVNPEISWKKPGPKRKKFSRAGIQIGSVKRVAPLDGIGAAGIVKLSDFLRFDILPQDVLFLGGEISVTCDDGTDLLDGNAKCFGSIMTNVIMLHDHGACDIHEKYRKSSNEKLLSTTRIGDQQEQKAGCHNVDSIAAKNADQQRGNEKQQEKSFSALVVRHKGAFRGIAETRFLHKKEQNAIEDKE